MYAGLIIVINTIKNRSFKENFITTIQSIDGVEICLVCNNDSDIFSGTLFEIAEQCNNVDIVKIRNKKSVNATIRAGARFLNSKYNLRYIGFIIQTNEFKILEVLREYNQNQESVLELYKVELDGKAVKQTFNQSLFSITDYLGKLSKSSPI